MRNFISKLREHHQVKTEMTSAKIFVIYTRISDGGLGVDYFDSYEEITEEELEYYINGCGEIRTLERFESK